MRQRIRQPSLPHGFSLLAMPEGGRVGRCSPALLSHFTHQPKIEQGMATHSCRPPRDDHAPLVHAAEMSLETHAGSASVLAACLRSSGW